MLNIFEARKKNYLKLELRGVAFMYGACPVVQLYQGVYIEV